MGAIAFRPGIACLTMFPAYATIALIPTNCLKVFKWSEVNIERGAVFGSAISTPCSSLFTESLLEFILVGTILVGSASLDCLLELWAWILAYFSFYFAREELMSSIFSLRIASTYSGL